MHVAFTWFSLWAAVGLLVGQAGTAGESGAVITAFGFSEACLAHDTGARHVERPARIAVIRDRLRASGLLDEMTPCRGREDAVRWVTEVHAEGYVERVRESCRDGSQFLDAPDTPVSPGSYEAALAAVGVVLGAVDAVVEGECRNAFCAVRPPGHHAQRDRAAGFCIFNNVAIAARYSQRAHGLGKVVIVDWDLHHGNGTQAAFLNDPTVLYFSVHEFPAYPGTGRTAEQGEGPGRGTTINRPLPAGSDDEDYLAVLREALVPAAEEFEPDIVLISAGFDAHEGDPLGRMNVTAGGFAEMTRITRAIADRHCNGRLVSVLEGGYDLEALADCTEAHVRALME